MIHILKNRLNIVKNRPIASITIIEDSRKKRFSVFNIVASYRMLFDRATKEKGNLQPYLQQLSRYDAREIKEFEDAISLSEDIAIKALKTGMMSSVGVAEIRKKIVKFLSPEQTKAHGRLIDRDDAESCGLTIEKVNIDNKMWDPAYELYIRLNTFVSSQVAKCIESRQHSYVANLSKKP